VSEKARARSNLSDVDIVFVGDFHLQKNCLGFIKRKENEFEKREREKERFTQQN